MAAGLISQEEFRRFVHDFMKISRESNDYWEIQVAQGQEYLVKRFFQHGDPGQISHLTTALTTEMEELEDPDPACLETVTSDQLTYEFHVVYSEAYSVPVLYFNVYTPDGWLLSLDKVWDQIPKVYQDRLKDERWTFLTQQEHPLLSRPFYQLHPCHTATLMSHVASIDQSTPGQVHSSERVIFSNLKIIDKEWRS